MTLHEDKAQPLPPRRVEVELRAKMLSARWSSVLRRAAIDHEHFPHLLRYTVPAL